MEIIPALRERLLISLGFMKGCIHAGEEIPEEIVSPLEDLLFPKPEVRLATVKRECIATERIDEGNAIAYAAPLLPDFKVGEQVAARLSENLPFFPAKVIGYRRSTDDKEWWIKIASGDEAWELPERLLNKEVKRQ